MSDFRLSFPWRLAELEPLCAQIREEVVTLAKEQPPVVARALAQEVTMTQHVGQTIRQAVTLLEYKGVLDGFQGRDVAETPILKIHPSYQPEWDFLAALRTDGYRGKSLNRRAEAAFLGSFAVYSDWCERGAAFMHGLALSWSFYASDKNITTEQDELIADQAEKLSILLKLFWEMGCASRLKSSVLLERLHRIPVEDMIQLKGWLRGRAARLLSHPTDSVEHEAGKMLLQLWSHIVQESLSHKGLGFGRETVTVLPEKIKRFKQRVYELETSSVARERHIVQVLLNGKTKAFQSGVKNGQWSVLEVLLNHH